MARVTVEDCVEKVPNRFELVMLAAQRARNIGAGTPLTVERDNDKNPVIALREIADETVSLQGLEDNLVQSLQKVVEFDEPGEDEVDLLAIHKELGAELGEPRVAEAIVSDDLHVEGEDADADELPADDETDVGGDDLDPGSDEPET